MLNLTRYTASELKARWDAMVEAGVYLSECQRKIRGVYETMLVCVCGVVILATIVLVLGIEQGWWVV